MEPLRHGTQSEEGGAAEMWRHTLSQIPSTFGKLVYISSLRDVNTGRYEHHGLAQLFGEQETEKALRESHRKVFAEWLSYNLEQQKEDLDRYLSSFQVDKRTILATWTRLTPYRNLMPADLGEPERKLYLADFEAVLDLLRNEHDVALTDPDA
jgi:hypothetical protein